MAHEPFLQIKQFNYRNNKIIIGHQHDGISLEYFLWGYRQSNPELNDETLCAIGEIEYFHERLDICEIARGNLSGIVFHL